MSRRNTRDTAPELVVIDYLCSSWARWAGDQLAEMDWPRNSMCARILQWHELGVSAERLFPGPKESPPHVDKIDRAIAKLPQRLQKVLIVEYFSGGSSEVKGRRIGISRLAYRQRLEGALWALWGKMDGTIPLDGLVRRRD